RKGKNNFMSVSNRRMFLQKSAVLSSGALVSSLFKTSSFSPGQFSTDSPVASTQYGQVRGYTDKGVTVFKGIRYGADTSKRRFMPPLPPEKWHDIINTVEYGPSCPQGSRGGEKMSEDCLLLNVFTPA